MSVFQKITDVPGMNNAQGLLATGVIEIHEDTVVEDPLWLMGMLVPDKDVEIQINGPLMCGVHQAFDLSKGGTITGKPEIEAVNPCWWGADPDHVEDSSPAINESIAFCTGTYKPALQFIAGNYLCMDRVVKGQNFYMPTLRGLSGGNNGEPGGVQLDFSRSTSIGLDGNGEPEACVLLKGGSGRMVTGGLDRFTILCNSNQAGLVVDDQGGVLISNVVVLGAMDSVQLFAEHGFCEWNKFANCTFNYPVRNAVRFKSGPGATSGEGSFHGVELLDCWTNLPRSSPAAIEVGPKCYWYNGTLRLRVFFDNSPDGYQDVLHVDAGARDPEIDGYIKTEGGAGRGRLASGRNVDFPGNVLSLGGITWGSMRPKHYMMTMGPEGGATNGGTISWGKPFSYGPRAIVVDGSGNWETGLYLPGEFDCEIAVTAANYEYHISGIARPNHYGNPGVFNKSSSWAVVNNTGWGEPSFSVNSGNRLMLNCPNYKGKSVNFWIWYSQRSISQVAFGKFATMTP